MHLQVMKHAQAGLKGQAVPQCSKPFFSGLERRDAICSVTVTSRPLGGRGGHGRNCRSGSNGGSCCLLRVQRRAGRGRRGVFGAGAQHLQSLEVFGLGDNLQQNAGIALVPGDIGLGKG